MVKREQSKWELVNKIYREMDEAREEALNNAAMNLLKAFGYKEKNEPKNKKQQDRSENYANH